MSQVTAQLDNSGKKGNVVSYGLGDETIDLYFDDDEICLAITEPGVMEVVLSGDLHNFKDVATIFEATLKNYPVSEALMKDYGYRYCYNNKFTIGCSDYIVGFTEKNIVIEDVIMAAHKDLWAAALKGALCLNMERTQESLVELVKEFNNKSVLTCSVEIQSFTEIMNKSRN